MKLIVPAAFLALVAVAGVILAARDLVHRQDHTAHVATVAVKAAANVAKGALGEDVKARIAGRYEAVGLGWAGRI